MNPLDAPEPTDQANPSGPDHTRRKLWTEPALARLGIGETEGGAMTDVATETTNYRLS